jgi:fucose 4-O-acetylase-like acetyltransferase
MKTTRLISIDIAKAICIILVVIGHYNPDNSPEWYNQLNQLIYTFHMPLFVFVSGYVYWATRKPVNYKDFIEKKFNRLMIPYFFVSVIIIGIKLLSEKGLHMENPVSITTFYEMLYLPVAGYFLWFIYTLFLIFLIAPFFSTNKKLIIFLILSLILFCVPLDFPNLFCLAQLKNYLFYFVLGCVLYEWVTIRHFVSKIHSFITLLIFVGFYMLNHFIEINWIIQLTSFCLPPVGIIFISTISKHIAQRTTSIKNVLIYVSTCSYTIYLFHTTFEGFAKALLLKIPIANYIGENPAFIVSATIVVAVGVIAPMIIHNIIVRRSKLFSFLIGSKFIGD